MCQKARVLTQTCQKRTLEKFTKNDKPKTKKKNREKIHFCEKCRRRRRQMTETKKKSLDFEKKKIDLILGPFWREEASFIQNSSNALKNNATMTTTMAMRAPFSSVPSLSYSSLSSKGKHGTSTSRGRRQKKCVKIVLSSSASTATTGIILIILIVADETPR